jgi:hypothetical protein
VKADNLQIDTNSKSWLKFLARWSLFTSAVIIALLVAILAFVLPASRTRWADQAAAQQLAVGTRGRSVGSVRRNRLCSPWGLNKQDRNQ